MFSVIIPLYNKAQSIKNTVHSVLNQTFKDFEIVIIDDGSKDESANVVKKIQDERLRLIRQENQGVSVARNKGIEEASRDWVVFLDGDDLWEEDHLKELREMIQKYPNDKVFCTSFVKSNQQKPIQNGSSFIVIENYFKEVIRNNFFWTSVTCLHKSVFNRVGKFDKRFSRGEDMELWTRIGREYRFVKSTRVTAVYRIDAENRSDLTFNLDRSRIYHYDFQSSTSEFETIYYRDQVAKILWFLIVKKNFRGFFRLLRKHYKYIKISSFLKK